MKPGRRTAPVIEQVGHRKPDSVKISGQPKDPWQGPVLDRVNHFLGTFLLVMGMGVALAVIGLVLALCIAAVMLLSGSSSSWSRFNIQVGSVLTPCMYFWVSGLETSAAPKASAGMLRWTELDRGQRADEPGDDAQPRPGGPAIQVDDHSSSRI